MTHFPFGLVVVALVVALVVVVIVIFVNFLFLVISTSLLSAARRRPGISPDIASRILRSRRDLLSEIRLLLFTGDLNSGRRSGARSRHAGTCSKRRKLQPLKRGAALRVLKPKIPIDVMFVKAHVFQAWKRVQVVGPRLFVLRVVGAANLTEPLHCRRSQRETE
jgi:hypothetical protein